MTSDISGREIVEAVRRAGVTGAGGAGFPSHVKLQAAVDTVIANGCECEPLLCSDRCLMEKKAEAVIKGLRLAMTATGAQQGVIGVKKKYPATILALEQAAAPYKNIRLHPLPDYYPMGDEQVLCRIVSGRSIPLGGIPAQAGVLVHNVTTLAQIARAVEGKAITRRLVSVLGEVAEPKVMEVPLGTPIDSLIEWAGGGTVENRALILGGPMMGGLAQGPQDPVTKTLNAVLVLPAHHPLVISKRKKTQRMKRQAAAYCQGCGSCTLLCPRNALGLPLAPHRIIRAAGLPCPLPEEELTTALACSQCGVCGNFACPMGLNPALINFELKRSAGKNKIVPKRKTASSSAGWFFSPGIPAARLLHKLGLGKYKGRIPLDEAPHTPHMVRLPLKQHLGISAVPVVKPQDQVKEGDPIGVIPDRQLGAAVHASLTGRVAQVGSNEVVIVSDPE